MTLTLELGKTYLTRDGRRARVIATDRTDDRFPVVALVAGFGLDRFESINCYDANGQRENSPLDLVSEYVPPPEKIVRYVNFYLSPSGIVTSPAYVTRRDANAARHDRIACKRVACKRVEFSRGEFDD